MLASCSDVIMIGYMIDPQRQEFLDLAKKLALEAANISLPQLGRATASRKPDNSIVTEVDHSIQSRMIEAISRKYPDHKIIAEESQENTKITGQNSSMRYCWVIDPLDGTRNYVNSFPCFGTSIAVLDEGVPVVGVISEHNLGRVYWAVEGAGAFMNDKPLHVALPGPQDDLLIGVPSTKDDLTKQVLGAWMPMRHFIMRNLGSLAFHLALVASGSLSACFCKRCKIWDIAAGILLIREAGGVFTDPFGKNYTSFDVHGDPSVDVPVLTASPALHQRLLETIQQATQ